MEKASLDEAVSKQEKANTLKIQVAIVNLAI
jgi:hypothetical protein